MRKTDLWAEWQQLNRVIYVLAPTTEYHSINENNELVVDQNKRKKHFRAIRKKIRRLKILVALLDQNSELSSLEEYELYKKTINKN